MRSGARRGRVAAAAAAEAVRRPLHLLRAAPRELWLVYALKVLDSYGYFALSEVFTLLLTDEFGIGDVRAGAYYGAWGTAITLYGVLTGFLIDAMGVRTSLVVGIREHEEEGTRTRVQAYMHAHAETTRAPPFRLGSRDGRIDMLRAQLFREECTPH